MSTNIASILQQPGSEMLLSVLILLLVAFVLHRVIVYWQQMPVREDKKFQDAFWED